MHVGDVMTRKVVSCHAESTLAVAGSEMLEGRFGVLPVVDHGSKVVGMITDRDIARAAVTRQTTPDAAELYLPTCNLLLLSSKLRLRQATHGRPQTEQVTVQRPIPSPRLAQRGPGGRNVECIQFWTAEYAARGKLHRHRDLTFQLAGGIEAIQTPAAPARAPDETLVVHRQPIGNSRIVIANHVASAVEAYIGSRGVRSPASIDFMPRPGARGLGWSATVSVPVGR